MKRFGQVLIVAAGLGVLLTSIPLPATAGICKGNTAPCVTANDIKNDAVHPKHIKAVNSNDIVDGAIKTVDIKDNAITEAKLSQAVRDLLATITTLQTTIATMQATITTQAIQITTLQTDLAANLLPSCMQTAAVAGRAIEDVIFRGCNVHIQNGHTSARTDTANGVGNLIIGYNEANVSYYGYSPVTGTTRYSATTTTIKDRSGSHNLVVGAEHSYSSYGGLVAGFANSVSGWFASISGGSDNTASGKFASISGGDHNMASGDYASVSGGERNTASGRFAHIGGGQNNAASGVSVAVNATRPAAFGPASVAAISTRLAAWMPASAAAEATRPAATSPALAVA